MNNTKQLRTFAFFILMLMAKFLSGQIQAQDRFIKLEQDLNILSEKVTGLNEKVDFSVTGISIQDFLRAIAESNKLNLSIDPKINIILYNNFKNEDAKTVILFLCKEYNLDLRFVGSIVSIYPYNEPIKELAKPVQKLINLSYNAYDNTLSLSLRNDTLDRVLEEITKLSNKNVILHPEVNPNQLINGYILNTSFKSAIEKIAFTNNLSLEISPDSFYILKKLPKEEVINSSNTSTNKPNNYKQSNNNSGSYSLEIVDSSDTKLISFSTQAMGLSDIIRVVSEDAKKNYFLFSEPKTQVSLSVKRVKYDEFLTQLLNGSDWTFQLDNDVYMIGERRTEGLRVTKMFKLEFRSYKDIEKAIPSELRKGVEIKEFPELNGFIMSGSAPQIAEIEAITKTLDQVVPMVMIEVILVDIKRGKNLKTGIKAGLSDTTSGGSILPSLDIILSSASLNKILSPINLGKVSKNFYVGLSALDEQNYADVQSMPKLATLNSHKANMTIGETRYYKIQTQNVVGSINTNTLVTEQWNSVQANLSIDITPVVSGNEQVTLDIAIQIADFIGDPPGNAPPPSTSRQFTSLVRVLDGEMILLGGMERTSKSESGSGFPILSRIPILRWFFSTKSKSKSKSISFVFIKPTIVY